MKKEKMFKIIYAIIFILPLIIAVVSYCNAGETILDALYNSVALYGFGFSGDETPSLGLEIARWAAPLMMATSVLMIAKSVFSYLQVCVSALKKNSNIIYGNSECGIALCENEKNVVMCSKAPIRYGKNHFIMFDSDAENFSFYQKYCNRLKEKNVYVCLNEMDAVLLRAGLSVDDSNENRRIKFFSPNDVIARNFWKERALWNNSKTEWRIAIIGFGNLGRKILERALQLNLYSEKQSLKYYIFGDYKRFELTHSSMDLMNRDKILYYHQDSKEQWELLKTMDMIVLTEETDVELIQSILGYSASDTQVYYYSPNDDNLSQYIVTERLSSYGSYHSVFTLDNIKTDNLYENAKRLDKIYNKDSDWDKLSGFVKESNVSAADYGEIIQKLFDKKMTNSEIAKLEHIRWCRFHFLHYWRYGIPENGANKDEQKKIHKYLIPFEKLDEENKKRTVESIKMWEERKK